jgi:hypothetical protein
MPSIQAASKKGAGSELAIVIATFHDVIFP